MSADAFDPARNLAGGHDRLESWKEIAAFLKRDVRTVQRWEKLDGLPIYRHGPGRLGGVYAYKPQLDGWWDSVRARIENTPASAGAAGADDAPASFSPTRRVVPAFSLAVVLAAVLTCIALSVGIWWWRAGRPPAAAGATLGFQARDWVLITRFDNRTGDASLDDVLEYAVGRELANSRFVNVVPRERIDDALLLMKKPVDTRVDAVVGREICVRDGGIRALLSGRVEKFGSIYVLSAEVRDPGQGHIVASVSEEAREQQAFASGLRRLAERIRTTLGDTIENIDRAGLPLEKVTTASLKALQLYSRSFELGNRRQWPAALELARQSVAEDSEFASAQIWLAWSLRNTAQRQEALLPAQRALELSERTAAWERHWIVGSYWTLRGDDERAVGAYLALLSLRPDHYWAITNLFAAYMRMERRSEAVAYALKRADLRPNDFTVNAQAATTLVAAGDYQRADRYARRVSALAADRDDLAAMGTLAVVRHSSFSEAWHKGDMTAARRAVDETLQRVSQERGLRQQETLKVGVHRYLVLGNLAAAGEVARQLTADDERRLFMALVSLFRNDVSSVRSHIRDVSGFDQNAMKAWLLIRAGDVGNGEAMLKAVERSLQPSLADILRGEAALARGQVDRAIPLMVGAKDVWTGSSIPYFGVEALADAWLRRGDTIKAVSVLRDAWSHRPASSWGLPIAAWIRVGATLARVERRRGRARDALPIESELLKLLVEADPDFPLLVELKARQR